MESDKSKNVIFDNYFFNVDFLITKACTDFKCCLLSLHTHLEGTVSLFFFFGGGGPSFYFMTKIGKHFINFVMIIF